jgi:phosphate transport system substrate-binding protein
MDHIMKALNKTLVIAAVGAFAFAGTAQARDYVSIMGSSTVKPFADLVAEEYQKVYSGKFAAPVVEGGGSSAGLKEFCKGEGADTIDIGNASRAIKDSEIAACAANGVTKIIEIRIGYDGIVFANPVNKPAFAFEPKDIYLALAEMVPVDGKLANNPYTTWDQINPAFPKQEITMYIPGEKHGTREVFEEKVLEKGCEAAGGMDLQVAANGGDKKAAGKACMKVRNDGRSVDIDGEYTETLARIESNPDGIGVFGLSFAENNPDKVKVATVNGVTPTLETIAKGEYPVSRPLFFYVKGAHVDVIPGLREYVEFFLADDMIGDFGKAVDKGLIPMPKDELEKVRSNFKNGVSVGS